jgi:tetratricopeptide (TPR) repeat protein
MSAFVIRPGVLWSLITATLLGSCTYLPPTPETHRPPSRKPPVVIQRAKPQAPVRIIRAPEPVIQKHTIEELEFAQPAPQSRTQSAENRLYAQAELHANAAEFDKAEVAIERALRINPYSPSGYLRLAELHSRNQDWKGAEQLALKAISYAHYHPAAQRTSLKRAAWELILEARQAQGNTSGAREAQQKIDELQADFG